MVRKFIYLGHNISDDLCDDEDMKRIVRNLYATGNMLIRKFKSCGENVKVSLFKTYCYNVYCCALWSNYRVSTWRKLKVCHYDIFRALLNVPRFQSASSLFVNKRVNNMDVIIRKNVLSIKTRMETSSNSLCVAIRESEARIHSPIWKHFDVALRGSEVELFW